MDILLKQDNTGLEIRNGDLYVGDSDVQETYFIMTSTYNSFKHKPFYALNFRKNQNGPVNEQRIRRNIMEMLTMDGFERIYINFIDLENIDVSATK